MTWTAHSTTLRSHYPRGANAEGVIDEIDALLARYGGLGAYTRADQLSHRFLSEEFRQLESMATVYPTIFLGVAAFLLNVVFSRLFQTEREQIATLIERRWAEYEL